MSKPRITLAIPVLNEEAFIRETLDAVRSQTVPADEMEILVLDGGSRDRTRLIVESIANTEPRLQLLANPERYQASALNLALEKARGEFFVRVDARTKIAPDYVEICIQLLEEGHAENVGGRMNPRGTSRMGEAIALATSTPFGLGNSYFHYSDQEKFVDTVYLGAWRTKTLRQVGGFDEKAHANEDSELNIRLSESGGRILLSPRIHSTYTPRASWSALRHQYLRYGRWRAYTLWKHPASVKWRQIVPPLFLAALVITAILGLFLPPAAFLCRALVAMYIAVVVGASLITALPNSAPHLGRLLIIFPTIHLCWGAGVWWNSLRFAAGQPRPARCPSCRP
jgi:succinoglycan biosynthesis protein ExoA